MIFITGGTGFVGRRLVGRLRAENKDVRVLVHRAKLDYLINLGAEVVKGDILDSAGLDDAMSGCDTVIHMVGVWRANMKTYRRLHIEGAKNVLKAAKAAGIKRFIYISAMGVSLNIATGFYLTKAESEVAVKDANVDYTIFRPAVIIGAGDMFTTALVDVIKSSPIVPVLGDGKVLLQPLWVDDLVECIYKSLSLPKTIGQTYDIAGAKARPYDDILDILMDVLGVSKSKIHMPLGLLSPVIGMAECIIPNLPISSDELKIMRKDNVCDMSKVKRDFGLKPTGFREAVSKYLR